MANDVVVNKMLETLHWDSKESIFDRLSSMYDMLCRRGVDEKNIIDGAAKKSLLYTIDLIEKKNLKKELYKDSLYSVSQELKYFESDNNSMYNYFSELIGLFLYYDDYDNSKKVILEEIKVLDSKQWQYVYYTLYNRMSVYEKLGKLLIELIRLSYENMTKDDCQSYIYTICRFQLDEEFFSDMFLELFNKVYSDGSLRIMYLLRKLFPQKAYAAFGIYYNDFCSRLSNVHNDELFRGVLVSEKIFYEEKSTNSISDWQESINGICNNISFWNETIRRAIDVYVFSKLIIQGDYTRLYTYKENDNVDDDSEIVYSTKINENIQEAMYSLMKKAPQLLKTYIAFLEKYNWFKYDWDKHQVDKHQKISVPEHIELISQMAKVIPDKELVYIYMNTYLRSVVPLHSFINCLATNYPELIEDEYCNVTTLFGDYLIPVTCTYEQDSNKAVITLLNVYSNDDYIGIDFSALKNKLVIADFVGMDDLKATIHKMYLPTKRTLIKIAKSQNMISDRENKADSIISVLDRVIYTGLFTDDDKEELYKNSTRIPYSEEYYALNTKISLKLLEACASILEKNYTSLTEFLEFINGHCYFNIYCNGKGSAFRGSINNGNFVEKGVFETVVKQWGQLLDLGNGIPKRILYDVYFNTITQHVITLDECIRQVEQKEGIIDVYNSVGSKYSLLGKIKRNDIGEVGNKSLKVYIRSHKVSQGFTFIAQVGATENFEELGYLPYNQCECIMDHVDYNTRIIYLRYVITHEIYEREKQLGNNLQRIVSMNIIDDEKFKDAEALVNEYNDTVIYPFDPNQTRNLSKKIYFIIKNNIDNMRMVNRLINLVSDVNPCSFSRKQLDSITPDKHKIDERFLPELIDECDYRLIALIYFNTYLKYEYTINELLIEVKNNGKMISEMIPWLEEYELVFRKIKMEEPVRFEPRNFLVGKYSIEEEFSLEKNRLIVRISGYNEEDDTIIFKLTNKRSHLDGEPVYYDE